MNQEGKKEEKEDVACAEKTKNKSKKLVDEEYEYENDCEDEEDKIKKYIAKMHQGVEFPVFFFDEMQPDEVTRVPADMQGKRFYKVNCTEGNLTKLTRDRRWFNMSKSSKTGIIIRKTGKCSGSYVCENPTCNYMATEKHKNLSKWDQRVV